MSFFGELKRRNVVRVGIAYAVIGWVLAQIAEFAFENFGAPDWVLKSFVVLLLLAFPLVLFFAWAFELTPEGIKREKDVDRSQSITSQTGRKIDFVIIGVLVIGIAILAIDRFKPSDETAITVDQSIAVMPFADLSDGQTDVFFGRGIAEELLNVLAQFPELKVAARTSAFTLADEGGDLRDIGSALGVAHVLEGSVRRVGEQLRVTAQLIRSSDGIHLWSDTYDRPASDVLTIQDEIVREIIRALEIRLGVGAGSGRARQHDVDTNAYETYLEGLHLWATRHAGSNRRDAITKLRLATELDPKFADAWSAYALSVQMSSPVYELIGIRRPERNQVILDSLETALLLDPQNARAHAGMGMYYGRAALDLALGLEHVERAITLAPNSAFTHYSKATIYRSIGDHEQARQSMQRARLLDPLNSTMARVEAEQNALAGRFPRRIFVHRRMPRIEVCQRRCAGQ